MSASVSPATGYYKLVGSCPPLSTECITYFQGSRTFPAGCEFLALVFPLSVARYIQELIASSLSLERAAMGRRGAAATLSLHLMLVATLTLAAATFMSTAEAGCSKSMAQQNSNTSGRFRVPEGGEDGIYMGTVEVDEQGVEQYRVKYLGAGNATLDAYGRWATNNFNVSRPGGLGRKLLQPQDSGAHCQPNYLEPYSVVAAVTKLANNFGPEGKTMPANSAVYTQDRNTTAYLCNYNPGGLRTNSQRILTDSMYISAACGDDSGGYYSRETSNSASGRTYKGNNFC